MSHGTIQIPIRYHSLIGSNRPGAPVCGIRTIENQPVGPVVVIPTQSWCLSSRFCAEIKRVRLIDAIQ
jgi:hypothetical protein